MTAWYADYFTADFWSFARHEYTAERTAGEVAYLLKTLEAHAPGRRVLDLGCGVGRHAVPLAEHGYEVTGVDVCRWALDRAAETAAEAGVPLRLVEADLLGHADLPEVDAVICLQAFGWGQDAEQARLLRRVRDLLVPGGLLVLDHSNVDAILRRYQPTARFEAEGTVFDFLRTYDTLSGRSRGELRVTYPGGAVARLRDDVRLYRPPEVASLLAESGFDVLRADADFTPDAPVGLDTRYVQFLAHRRPLPQPAVLDHTRPSPAPIDLRSAPDEVDFVRHILIEAWTEVTGIPPAGTEPGAQPGTGWGVLDLARDYALRDPYGGERAAPALSRHFGTEIAPDRVVAGAGTTGLLHTLSALAGPGTVLCTRYAHPDLPGWAARQGATLRIFDPAAGDAAEVVAAERPSLVLVERPGVLGDLLPADRVAELAHAAHRAGALLVLDEACAAYAGPGASAVPLTAHVPGLVVLRSLSKGYCSGGLRAGFAVCSPGAAPSLRRLAPPLAISSLSFEVALHLLARGDVLAPLRAALETAKPELVTVLRHLGRTVNPGDPALPWVTVEGDPPPGITGKPIRALSGAPGAGGGTAAALTRISVPLSARRRAAVVALGGR
ncbi:aminotransferase class I/II-fold pyridoxal phosphate-dependent enzyme [Sphaerisporangium aureirubrum]|uniref:Aminotransferase class I/II-fold pyridoxal phosphate-dependent enzyme n=1 Tax=Sphaerisporangium aureirubrum TaxID=1544736 RepID=A0ABW1NS55_9ACTN